MRACGRYQGRLGMAELSNLHLGGETLAVLTDVEPDALLLGVHAKRRDPIRNLVQET